MALIVPPVDQLKRQALERADGEQTMFPTLVAVREGRVLAVVSTPRMAVTLSCAHTFAVGLAPQVLVLAAQVNLPDGQEGISYTSMSREREAGFAVQPYAVSQGELSFGTPQRGQVGDRSLMDELARAMSHETMDDTRVSRKTGPGPTPDTNRAPSFIGQTEGRMALDAGTCSTVQRRVGGIGGTTLFLARDGEHATRLLAHGMPEQMLLR